MFESRVKEKRLLRKTTLQESYFVEVFILTLCNSRKFSEWEHPCVYSVAVDFIIGSRQYGVVYTAEILVIFCRSVVRALSFPEGAETTWISMALSISNRIDRWHRWSLD